MKYAITAVMAGVALYIVWQRKEQLTDGKHTEFREGFAAGFLTPGPFTILAISGAAVAYF